MTIATVTAGVLAANFLTIWLVAMAWRIKRDDKDLSAIAQACGLLMAIALTGVAAAQSLPVSN